MAKVLTEIVARKLIEQCYCLSLHTVFLGINNFVTYDIQDVLITTVILLPEKFLKFD